MASRGWLSLAEPHARWRSTGIFPLSVGSRQLLNTGFSTLSLPYPIRRKPAEVLREAQLVHSGQRLELEEASHPGNMIR